MPDTLNDAAFDDLVNVGRDVLRVFPIKPGACVMMSALYAGGLRARGHTSVELVGGVLAVGGETVFGRSWEATTFTTTDLDWGGHAWIRYGEFIADVSILRTGFSSRGCQISCVSGAAGLILEKKGLEDDARDQTGTVG